MIVGLAGKACAGKDSLVPWFRDRGFLILDADRLGHQALEACAPEILARFGTIDRKALGAIVFRNPNDLADLEAISHPWIKSRIVEALSSHPGNVVINAALLHKAQLWTLCDIVVWVYAPLVLRILRARQRDNWTWKRIFERIWTQRELRPQVFSRDVDIVIVDNGGSHRSAVQRLEAQLEPFLETEHKRITP